MNDEIFDNNLTELDKNKALKLILDYQRGARQECIFRLFWVVVIAVIFITLTFIMATDIGKVIEINLEPKPPLSSRRLYGIPGLIHDLLAIFFSPMIIAIVANEFRREIGELKKWNMYFVTKCKIVSSAENPVLKEYLFVDILVSGEKSPKTIDLHHKEFKRIVNKENIVVVHFPRIQRDYPNDIAGQKEFRRIPQQEYVLVLE